MNPYLIALFIVLLPSAGDCMSEVKPTQNPTKTEVYSNQLPDKGASKMGIWETLSIIKKIVFESTGRAPKSKLPEGRPDLPAFILPGEKLKFIWLGHSTFMLNLDGKIILVDPVFYNASPVDFLVKRFQRPVVKLENLPHVDTIVISHDHYDHLDQRTVEFFKDKTANFIVPLGVGNHLKDWGIDDARITQLNWNESFIDEGITFTAAPAQHFSGRGLFDKNETLWASWIIAGKTEKIYYSGDSGYGPHFKEIGLKHGPFDYAFLENGQYNERWPDIHMQPEDTLQALIDLNADTLIPVHWGMFDLSLHHWSEPIVRTYKIAKDWHLPMITPKIGELVDTESYKNTPWWEDFLRTEEKSIQPVITNIIPIRELAPK